MSGDVMTLTEFLLARIAEDEAVARAVVEGPWFVGPVGRKTVLRHDRWHPNGRTKVADAAETPDAAHIALHDPARVLAECEAKRRIILLVEMTIGVPTMPAILRVLVMPYADHPDYLPEWKP